MSGRRWLWVLALGAATVTSACSDSVGPTTPLQKKASLAKPTGASFGRYILISGVVTCVEECDDDGGPGQRVDGLPATSPDTLQVLEIPADTSSAP